MPYLEVLSVENAPAPSQAILNAIQKKTGKLPNIYAAMAHSPAALQALVNFRTNLSRGELNNKEVETISLVVGQINGCDYCVNAHTAISKIQGLSEEETVRIRKGQSPDPKLKALIDLATEIVTTGGHPSHSSMDAFFRAGYSKAALVETIGWIALNIFTNYFNHIAETPIDFPKAPEIPIKRCCCS